MDLISFWRNGVNFPIKSSNFIFKHFRNLSKRIMTSTDHKLLRQSHEFVREFQGQISCYSEGATEARNNDLKTIRRGYTRKSKKNTYQDIISRRLITSPMISEVTMWQAKHNCIKMRGHNFLMIVFHGWGTGEVLFSLMESDIGVSVTWQ